MKETFVKLGRVFKQPHWFFLIVTVFFGGVMILIFPPYQTPDEGAHFLRAYQISNFDFVPYKKDGVVGSYLPKSLQKTESVIDSGNPLQTHPNAKYKLGNTKAALFDVPLNKDDVGFVETSVTASYSPVGYIPQVLAIWVGRIFQAPPILMLYLARIAVLLTWAVLLFWTIKLFPIKKWAVAGVALLPMFIAQAVSLGVDVLAVGGGAIFTALIVRQLIKGSVISKKTLALLILSGVAMVLSKQIMVLLLPLVVLLPKQSFNSKRLVSLMWKGLVILLPLLLFVAWSAALPDINQNVTQLQNQQSSSGQIQYMLAHPSAFFEVLRNTFLLPGPGDGVVQSLIGNFGWLDTPLAMLFMMLGYGVLFGYLFITHESNKVGLGRARKLFFLCIAILYCLGVAAALYIIFSPVASKVIIGIQGRYLFPCLFLLIPVFSATFIRASSRQFVRFVQVSSIALLIISAVTIIFRYYINVY